MSHNLNDVLLIGAGYMAKEYVKVLRGLQQNFTVIGRGAASAEKFAVETGIAPYVGGLAKYISEADSLPDYAIVAVSAGNLVQTTLELLAAGVKHILLEKPGALSQDELKEMESRIVPGGDVSIAYNRRLYASTRKARELIAEDGGVTSFCFEFTEWTHVIAAVHGFDIRDLSRKRSLFIGNSSHVVDLAFYLGGAPQVLTAYADLAEDRAVFAGAGKAVGGALFNYQANWSAPGRWGVEVMTNSRRFIFRPLEKLSVQKMKSVAIESVEIDEEIDLTYKPGVYLETKAFLQQDENFPLLCSLNDQIRHFEIYAKMLGD